MNQVVNINSMKASQRGLTACPSPLDNVVVTAAMSAWGNYQWQNRDVDKSHGYPAINPLSVQWGLGRGEDFDYDQPMPVLAELSHGLVLGLGPVAVVIAWLYWAHPSGSSIRSTVSMANHILPCNITRSNVEMWLSAIAGTVLGALGDDCFDDLIEQQAGEGEPLRGVL